MMRILIFISLILIGAGHSAMAQLPQNNSVRMTGIFSKVEDSIRKEFAAKNMIWPPNYVYLRSFKYDREFEIWIKYKAEEQYQFFKSYRVCQQSGKIGPKRMEGDYQVPEGFYYIDEFKPNSAYHLALGVNYPNSSDRILSDPRNPGSRIFVHGNCVSTGCIPLTDMPMERLYVLASRVKEAGYQEFIPMHIYPVRFKNKASMEALVKATENSPSLKKFADNLKPVYDYFESKKNLPIILVNQHGEYVIN